MSCERHKELNSPYTPSGLPSWLVMKYLIENDWNWSRTMEGVMRGAIFEEDLMHAKRYYESHTEEVLSILEREASQQPSLD